MWNENSRCFMRSLVIHLTFILKSDIWMHNRHKMLSVPCARFTAYILSVSSTYTTTTLSFVLLNYLYSVNVDIPTWYLYFSVFSCIFATLWSLYFRLYTNTILQVQLFQTQLDNFICCPEILNVSLFDTVPIFFDFPILFHRLLKVTSFKNSNLCNKF